MCESWKAIWECAPGVAERLSAALAAPPDADAATTDAAMTAEAVALTPLDAAGEATDAEDNPAQWRVEAYFSTRPDVSLLAGLARSSEAPLATKIEALPKIDWVAHSLQGLGVVRAGRFQLYGAHDAGRIETDPELISIRIDANQAFGTGHHPTTAGCLEALDALNARGALDPLKSGAQALDLGCGSAVLAIAVAKICDAFVIGADIDPKAVEIARDNCALNDVANRVQIIEADGLAHPEITARSPYPLILANILAGPLIALAPAISAAAAPDSVIILAGLLDEQHDAVVAAYDAHGFSVRGRHGAQRWPVLTLTRS